MADNNEDGSATRLVVSPRARVRWVKGNVQIGTGPGGPAISSPDGSPLQLLAAFSSPRTAAEVAAGFGPARAQVERAIADFTKAGFLVVAQDDDAGSSTSAQGSDSEQSRNSEQSGDSTTERPAKRASVIMPTYNKAAFLDLTLASYVGQTAKDFEILVVDDGGSDNTREVVACYAERLDVHYLRREHAGRAAARNAAIEQARGTLLIFSDDDRLVTPHFVEKHLAAHNGSAGDESHAGKVVLGWMYGVVTLLTRELTGPLYPVLAKRLEGGRAVGEGTVALVSAADIEQRLEEIVRELGTIEPDWENKVEPAVKRYGESLQGLSLPWLLGSTGNMSAPRALVQKAGMLDAGYTGYGMEDTDLCYALCRAGAHCTLSRHAANYHQLHAKKNMAREIGQSMRYFVQKYDNLEAYLFVSWFFKHIDLQQAHAIATQAAAGDDAHRAALTSLLRDQVRRELSL